MRVFALFIFVLIFSLFQSCSEKSNKENSKTNGQREKETLSASSSLLPEGYPPELSLPPGITPNDIETGKGRKPTPGGINDEIFNVYVVYKKHPKNYKEIVAHYKKLLTKANNWQGSWDNSNPGQLTGSFKKDNVYVAVEISRSYFSLKIEVFDSAIS